MEVHHKSYPVRSWREFIKEIGIIVIGVLIALGAEQTAEALHWRHKVEEADGAMRLELPMSSVARARRPRSARRHA